MPNYNRVSDEKRYKIDSKTGCWNYTMSLMNGYGAYCPKNSYKTMGAHRYFYEKYKGKIKKGFVLDHLCRNSKCVNPKHLQEVTYTINTRRGLATKLNWNKVNKIKELYRDGMKQPEIGRKFNIHQCQVSRIINNLRWKEEYA